ncbi:hypothetical protein M3215_09285 [Bacillus cytotoxicus]|uniref:Uncharacterized protein n=1 Tax=Bacillus cytotoxicus TaxID=580165 RepID=A0ACC6A601_9BACI|nr:hypothetical protein [Bacillus cytotoxicus]
MKFKKTVIGTLSVSLLSASLLSTTNSYAAENSTTDVKTNVTNQFPTPSNSLTESTELDKVLNLDKVLKQENIPQKELVNYRDYVQEQVGKESMKEGKIGAAKKAIKFMVEHSDTIPIKYIRDLVNKYGGKIIEALDVIEVYTWYGITVGLMKVGIPEKYASMIADFIVKFIL